MASVQKFEDLEVWQAARTLARGIYSLSNTGPFAKDFGLRDQIRRAAVSVSSNIAEGFERHSDTDLKRFLTIARGSNGEVRSQLQVAQDLGYITVEEFNQGYSLSVRIGKMLTTWMSYLNQQSPNDPSHS